ncbi:hypothetical protein EGK75_13410 [Neisseria weixii]|uniref:Uncharacterized protein n=1 Tax=Neisseria weixii TaxID=1853276 RepID=A0A3N4MVC6_9NEIS|nr:hypothetical protein [Neisseria weixii]RPD83149.1 hypothetical protein EGK74_13335 [Neisseria weixii]RPD83312.1 hypothetical protein EGK75_13410 [Neisseria weixii]
MLAAAVAAVADAAADAVFTGDGLDVAAGSRCGLAEALAADAARYADAEAVAFIAAVVFYIAVAD